MNDALKAELQKRNISFDEPENPLATPDNALLRELKNRNLLPTENTNVEPGPAPSLQSFAQPDQEIPFGSIASFSNVPGENFSGQEMIDKGVEKSIVPAAQIAVSMKPELKIGSMLMNALRVGAVTPFAGGIRDMFKGKEVSPENLVIEGGKEAITHTAIGSIFKLAAKSGEVPKQAWEKVNEFAKKYDLPAMMMPESMRAKAVNFGRKISTSGEKAYQRNMTAFTEKITNFITEELSKTKTPPPLEDLFESMQKTFNPRKDYVNVKNLIGGDFKIDMQPFYNVLPDLINNLKTGGDVDVANMLEAASEAFAKLPANQKSQSFDKVDGLITNITKKISAGGIEDSKIIIDEIYSTIARSLENADPQLVANLTKDDQTIKDALIAANQTYAKLSKKLKGDKLLRSLAYGRIDTASSGKFLTQWSTSKKTRDAVKEIDPTMWRSLNEAWLGRNVDRFLFRKDQFVGDGTGLRGFMESQKKDVLDMFGEDGFETLNNFTHYLDATKNFVGKAQQLDTTESLLKGLGSTGTGAAVGSVTGGMVGQPGMGSMVGAAGMFGLSELTGGLLVQQLLKPNSTLNLIFGKGVDTISTRPSLIGGPLSFENDDAN